LTKPQGNDETHAPDSFSPDGRNLAFTVRRNTGVASAVWVLSLPDKKTTLFSKTVAIASRAAFSPDGRWLAYQSADAATAGVLVEPFPPTGVINQIARRAATTPHHPFWSRDGKELFYVPGPNTLSVVRVTTQPAFSVSDPLTLSRGAFLEGGPEAVRSIDILPDGRFIRVVEAEQTEAGANAARINVVLNWTEELKRLVPAR
jgi:Tol biopolymer transport system component